MCAKIIKVLKTESKYLNIYQKSSFLLRFLHFLNKYVSFSRVSIIQILTVFNSTRLGQRLDKGSGDRFLILIFLVNIQYSRKGLNSSSEHVGTPVFDF